MRQVVPQNARLCLAKWAQLPLTLASTREKLPLLKPTQVYPFQSLAVAGLCEVENVESHYRSRTRQNEP